MSAEEREGLVEFLADRHALLCAFPRAFEGHGAPRLFPSVRKVCRQILGHLVGVDEDLQQHIGNPLKPFGETFSIANRPMLFSSLV